MAQTFFWLSLIALVYIYVGYPIVVYVAARLRTNRVRAADDYEVSVTVVIAAHNEARVIRETVRNKLEQTYPSGKLRVLVVSDGCVDGTDDEVLAVAAEHPGRVRLMRQEPRAGKTAALNMALREIDSEIVVFSDANSLYDQGAVRALVRNFADPAVGYVTGKMVYVKTGASGTSEGCSAYMRYENFLREQETALGSVVGVDGGVDAVRRALYKPMAADQLPDFVLPLNVVDAGYRAVYEPNAVVKERALEKMGDEYRMRVRVSLRALWALWDMRHLLNPLRRPGFAFQLCSHKVLRYAAFVFLAMAVLANIALLDDGPVYAWLLVGQVVFYGGAAFGFVAGKLGRNPGPAYLPYYFTLLNVASAQAFVKFLLRQKQVLWKPRLG